METDLAHIPLVQKRIIAVANAAARPVVTATQLVESMVEHERPTRAEVTDVANALLDGPWCAASRHSLPPMPSSPARASSAPATGFTRAASPGAADPAQSIADSLRTVRLD